MKKKICLVLAVMLPLGPAFIAVCVVLLTDVSILAWIPITGLNLNAITSTCMVMSVGIAVDFTAHVTHAFVETDGAGRSGGERAAAAVSKTLDTIELQSAPFAPPPMRKILRTSSPIWLIAP